MVKVRKAGWRKRATYSAEDMDQALDAVKNLHMPIREASRTFDVPKTTLSDILKGGRRIDGRKTELTEAEERLLVAHIKLLGTWGFPVSAMDLRMMVREYMDRRGIKSPRFKENMPTHRWVSRFLARHKDLTLRAANPIKRSRASVSREDVTGFIHNWEQVVAGVPPENIYNYDETAFRDDPGKTKVLVKKGMKYVEKVQNTSKQSFTVMMWGSAAGLMEPPQILFGAANLYTSWCRNGPQGAIYSCSKRGWMDIYRFREFFFNLALPKLRRLHGKKVLIGDNHSSHISIDIIEACRQGLQIMQKPTPGAGTVPVDRR